MANYQNTVLLDALSMLQEQANKDLRAPAYGATRAFNDRKRNVILNYDEFQAQPAETGLRSLKVDYLRRSSGSVGSSRSASLTGAMGDSTRDTLTFVTYSREFTVSDDVVNNNTFSAAAKLANQIKNARLDIGAAVETAAIAKLEAYLNTVDVSSPLSTWSGATAYRNVVATADEDQYFNIIETEMKMRDYNGPLQIVNYGTLNKIIMHQGAQGVGNSSNLQYQYGNKMFYTSNSITNSSDHIGTSYVVEEDSLALVDWVPPKNRNNLRHGIWDFTTVPDPFGIFDRMALAVYHTVQDSTSGGQNIGGDTQDAVWLYELSFDLAFYIPTITTQKLVNKYALSKT